MGVKCVTITQGVWDCSSPDNIWRAFLVLSTCGAFPRCRDVLGREGISCGEFGKGWPGAAWCLPLRFCGWNWACWWVQLKWSICMWAGCLNCCYIWWRSSRHAWRSTDLKRALLSWVCLWGLRWYLRLGVWISNSVLFSALLTGLCVWCWNGC